MVESSDRENAARDSKSVEIDETTMIDSDIDLVLDSLRASLLPGDVFGRYRIRKVLGASALKVVLMLNKDLLKLVVLANIIAWPVTYYLFEYFISGFPYRPGQNLSTFAISAISVLLIASVTISYQTLRAALKNPVDALKYE